MIAEMTERKKGSHDRGAVSLPTEEQQVLFGRTTSAPAAPTVTVNPQDTVARLRSLQKLNLVKVSPGYYRTNDGTRPPVLLIARTEEQSNGTVELVPAYEQWARLTPGVAAVLGLPCQYHTLVRLGRAGFIETALISPHGMLLNLPSYWGHLANVIEDPQYWDPETKRGRQRLEIYRRSIR